MILQGKAAWVFPDSFDVDYIIGTPNIGLTDLKQITACLMKDFDPEFLDSCAPGDMLIAGKSFGYGHAHPQPMAGMREIGIRCVVAESYLFPFFRSELASGMMLFTCPGITACVRRGDKLQIDTERSLVTNLTTGECLALKPLRGYPAELLEAGGVVEYLRRQQPELDGR